MLGFLDHFQQFRTACFCGRLQYLFDKKCIDTFISPVYSPVLDMKHKMIEIIIVFTMNCLRFTLGRCQPHMDSQFKDNIYFT